MNAGLLPLSGYVLAGGRSSRMGTDKALLQLGGRTLADRAVETLAGICERVRVVGAQPELRAFAPTVEDVFVGCGPLGGIEAALRDAAHDWVMVLPVDLAFVPQGLLAAWAGLVRDDGVRVQYLEAEGYPQPLVALLHREVLPVVQAALREGEYKVMRMYEAIGRRNAREGVAAWGQAVHQFVVANDGRLRDGEGREIAWRPSVEELALRAMWFGNLNTPEELALAEVQLGEAGARLAASKLDQLR